MRTHEVGKREGGIRCAGKNGSAFVETGHALTGEIVEAHQPAAVRITLQCLVEQARKEFAPIDIRTDQTGKFLQERNPGVDITGAVVAVDHGNRIAVRGRHHVDLTVNSQRMLGHNHGEVRGARRNVARARTHGIRRNHARAGISLARRNRNSGKKRSRRVKEAGARLGQRAAGSPCGQYTRQDRTEVNAGLFPELVDHALIVVQCRAVDREHAGGLADAHDLLTGQLPVDITGKRCKKRDGRDVGFSIQDGLIIMRDAPALRNIEAKQLGQLFSRFAGDRVAPGTEADQLSVVLIEGQVAVHHGRNAQSADGSQRDTEFLPDTHGQICKAGLQALLYEGHGIGPDAAVILILPFEGAGCNGDMVFVNQDGLDAGRAELDAKCGIR